MRRGVGSVGKRLPRLKLRRRYSLGETVGLLDRHAAACRILMQRWWWPEGFLGHICPLVWSALHREGETNLCGSQRIVRGFG